MISFAFVSITIPCRICHDCCCDLKRTFFVRLLLWSWFTGHLFCLDLSDFVYNLYESGMKTMFVTLIPFRVLYSTKVKLTGRGQTDRHHVLLFFCFCFCFSGRRFFHYDFVYIFQIFFSFFFCWLLQA